MKLIHFALACQVYILLMGEGMLSSNQNPRSWFDAQAKCISENGSLPEDFPKQVNYSGQVAIWRGVYRRVSTWIKILGCYTDNATEAVSSTAYIMQNLSKSAGFCQEICLSSNKTTFAIKDKICRCLKDRPRENETSPTLCNAFCYKPEDRGEKPYFEECGGKEFYSVYISAKDERKPMLDGVYCVAIQCSEKTNTFLFDRYCSSSKHPVCKPTDRILNASDWSQSMNICKSEPLSSYLTGEVFLDDINKTCKMIGKELPEGSWVGVANEVYTGIDRGIKIGKEELDMFTGCQVCFYKNTRLNNCSYVPCKEKQNVKLLCIQRDQENVVDPSSQTIGTLHTSTHITDFGSHEKTPPTTVSSTNNTTENFMMLSSTESTTAETINLNEKSEDALHMILPVAIAVSALAVIFALISKYVCHRHLKKQTSLQKPKSRKEHSECSTRSSNVTRIINHSYNTIELQEQGNRSSIPEDEDKIESPYMEIKEEIYNHLRDKQLSNDEDDNKCNYDTTKNVIAKREQCHESSKGIYDRLWDARRGTNSDETYHHAFSIISKSSVNEDTEKRKHVFDSPNTSNHILKSVPDVSYDEQDRSNLCEKHPEDHTYFILEQI